LGSDATFHWKFALDNDWSDFEEIVFGQTDNNARIRNKFITVYKNGNTQINRQLPSSLQTRVSVSGNVTQQGCDLVFRLQNVHRTDEQITYGCTAVVWGVWFRSGPVSLVTQVPPSITITTNSMDVNQGDDVTLPCDAQGDPTPYVEWSRGGRQLQRNRTQQSFLIPNIQPSHADTYVCRAVNRAGSVSYSLVVRVSPVTIG